MTKARRRASWLANQPLWQKVVLALGGLTLVLLVTTAGFLGALHRQDQARQWTLHSYQVLAEIGQMMLQNSRERASAMQYAQSPDPAVLVLHDEASRAFDAHAVRARRLTTDNPIQSARLESVERLISEWRQHVAPLLAKARGEPPALPGQPVDLGDAQAAALTRVLQEMRSAEESLLEQRSSELEETVRLSRAIAVLALVIGAGFSALCIFLASRQFTRPLVALNGLMTRLANNDHTIEIPQLDRRDEIGDMGRALEVFKKGAIQTSERNWIKSNLAEILGRLQHATDERAFGTGLLEAVARLLDVGVAVFYVMDDEASCLELSASYGYRNRRHVSPRYALGEGLVGQCAFERQTIVLTEVPVDYVRIHSGLGEAVPRTVMVLPVLLSSRLLAVVELGTFQTFKARDQRFLDELMPTVALALDNIQRASKTQQLLKETQTQAQELQASEEELRVRQEELRATNEALQEKTRQLQIQSDQLRASEEELRVQAEELRVANEELQEKTRALEEQKRVLQVLQNETQEKALALAQASQYKSEFLANMSHELRTPLNSLLILSQNLAENEEKNLTPDQQEGARIIHESGSNLLRVINDILDLSKVEAGKMELLIEDVSLAKVVDSLSRSFRHVAERKNLAFGIEIDPTLPATIQGDSGKLAQILNNLLGNAFKFTKSGSVRLRIGHPVEGGRALPGLSAAQVISFAVSDTGIGIPPDKFAKIFQAFEQVDGTNSRQFGGTGLGLSISRGFANLMKGEISVQSELGSGSTFTLMLPMQVSTGQTATMGSSTPAVQPVAKQHPPASAGVPAPQLAEPFVPDDRHRLAAMDTTILTIEDDPQFCRILVDMIRRKGFKALAAGNGETGIAIARSYKPTGILLDLKLPDIDGWSVLDRLKADPATRHVPVHIVSAAENGVEGLEKGAVGFLTKPVTRDAITAAFDRLLHFSADNTRRLLLVEDDENERKALHTLMGGPKVDIVDADSAEEALVKLREGSIDCIVLDLGLPGMSGFEFLEAASRQGAVPPVVVYSGKDLSREDDMRLREYTDSIVIKGVRSPERLIDEVTLFLHSVRNAPVAQVAAPNAEGSLSGRTVLIVDDDVRNIFALSRTLRSRGLKVVMAQDGEKALRLLDENDQVEIVLMDVMMPGMDGYETTRQIRKRDRLARLPIIAVTAKAMQGDREKSLEAGANDYLSKPIDLDKLLSMMRVWLSAA